MSVFMTSEAGWVQAFKGPVQILHQDTLTVCLSYVTGVVALLASQAGVTSLQKISGSSVIELRFRFGPLKDLEVFAIVLGVAACAIQIALARIDGTPVITFALRDQNANLLVTRQAAQFA
jgi:hypothetical protein